MTTKTSLSVKPESRPITQIRRLFHFSLTGPVSAGIAANHLHLPVEPVWPTSVKVLPITLEKTK